MDTKNGPDGTRSPKSKGVPLSKELQSHIGSKLRAVYGQMVQEPVPDRFSELLKQLSNTDVSRPPSGGSSGNEEPQT